MGIQIYRNVICIRSLQGYKTYGMPAGKIVTKILWQRKLLDSSLERTKGKKRSELSENFKMSNLSRHKQDS